MNHVVYDQSQNAVHGGTTAVAGAPLVFPVAGPAHFTDDWGDPRGEGRHHAGTDIMAAEGTPLVAVEDGIVKYGVDPLGGNIINLRIPDGTRYYYAHLSAFEGISREVRAGEVIGYVGRTGNAAATAPHCHFEIHPGGGAAVNPYPYLVEATRVATQPPRSSSGSSMWPWLLLGGGAGAAWVFRHRIERALRRI